MLNGLDKNVKKKNKRNGSYQGKKSDKEGYANDVKDKLEKVKQFIEKEENSFWDEDCLS
jgi:glutaredoxin 2